MCRDSTRPPAINTPDVVPNPTPEQRAPAAAAEPAKAYEMPTMNACAALMDSPMQILASRHLDYEALLRVVPQQGLLELRAALLERLGRWVGLCLVRLCHC